LNVGR